VVGRNWKSARRRLAHLLAEKVLPLSPVLTALGLWWCFLVVVGVDGGGNGKEMGIPRDSIGSVSDFAKTNYTDQEYSDDRYLEFFSTKINF
ncbi:hypothetical protein Tco_1433459, partial [Tanacetum coccineum]